MHRAAPSPASHHPTMEILPALKFQAQWVEARSHAGGYPLTRCNRITCTGLLYNIGRNKSRYSATANIPPLPRNLLACSLNGIVTFTRRQIANYRGFNINFTFQFHKSNFSVEVTFPRYFICNQAGLMRPLFLIFLTLPKIEIVK